MVLQRPPCCSSVRSLNLELREGDGVTVNTPAQREFSWVRPPASGARKDGFTRSGRAEVLVHETSREALPLSRREPPLDWARSDHVFSSGREAVANSEKYPVDTYVRLYAFLLGAWAECRLLKLIYEPSAFADSERKLVLHETALDRWNKVVDVSFRKHYRLRATSLKPPALAPTAHYRLTTLQKVLTEDLGSTITLRNKLAHGQWQYPLNESVDDIAQPQMDALRKENLLRLTQKRALLEGVCSTIHDLAVSRPTFERDWDANFRRVEQIRVNLDRKSYTKWCEQLRQNRVNGEKLRLEASRRR